MFKQWLIALGQYLRDQATLHSRELSRSFASKGPGKMPYHKGAPLRKYLGEWRASRRLEPARGAGSINVESDMQQLIRAGLFKAAAKLYEDHHAVVGAADMRSGNVWYRNYVNGQ